MTTIFLARSTHQSGIHYRTEPPDDGPPATQRKTQGATVDNQFKSSLGSYAGVMKDASVLARLGQNMKEKKVDEPVGSSTPPVTVNRVADAIFSAAQATYKDMWGEMKKKLKRSLEEKEVDYYNSIAKLRGEPMIAATDMAAVFSAVTEQTEKEIGGNAGFKP